MALHSIHTKGTYVDEEYCLDYQKGHLHIDLALTSGPQGYEMSAMSQSHDASCLY